MGAAASLKAWVLAKLLALPTPWVGEGGCERADPSPEAYRDRMEVIAEAIAVEVQERVTVDWARQVLAAAMVVLVDHESRRCLTVHSGEVRGDPRGPKGKSICLIQVQHFGKLTREEWLALAGTDLAATRRCIARGLSLYHPAMRFCYAKTRATKADLIGMAYERYAGKGCTLTARGRKRAEDWLRVMRR